ncbi:hypothetical protein BDZ45DRAFT_728035 [Acephala macrosclerotiorum]|nr:hypothetical protein BDZ45DRAFT_728035 [Acephala macrosclerotiorum]
MGDPKWGVWAYDLLYQFRHLGCTDPKDGIFGFLGLTPLLLDLKFKPHYNLTLNEVYRNFARCAIGHFQSLDILNYKREWRNVPPDTPVRWRIECWYDRVGRAREKLSLKDLAGKVIEVDWNRRFNVGEIPEVDLSKKEIKTYWAAETKDAIERYGVVAKEIFEACMHRALFVTVRGYLGLVPWNAKIGDKVFVLKGDRQLDAYELVGETDIQPRIVKLNKCVIGAYKCSKEEEARGGKALEARQLNASFGRSIDDSQSLNFCRVRKPQTTSINVWKRGFAICSLSGSCGPRRENGGEVAEKTPKFGGQELDLRGCASRSLTNAHRFEKHEILKCTSRKAKVLKLEAEFDRTR